MLNGVRIRSIYSKLQKQLFIMIPEKWDKLYLYAAVIENAQHIEKGEMFFYYYPKGILKKNPVNVYEIPAKFNIEEDSYMVLVNKLYDTIKELRNEFVKSNEKVWTNLTISIENMKFHVEYDYENLLRYNNYDRHIIWQYKYLGLSKERLSKKDQQMLEQYFVQEKFKNKEIKEHNENLYKKETYNVMEFDYNRESNFEIDEEQKEKKKDKYELYKQEQEKKKVTNNKESINEFIEENNIKKEEEKPKVEKIEKAKTKKLDKYELYKQEQELKKKKSKQNDDFNILKKKSKKNQILDF